MFQWYRWNTFRLLERNERESGRIFGFFRSQRRIGIIEIIEEKFYAILSLATSSSSCALFRSRTRGGGRGRPFIFTNRVEGKPALKRILSSPSRGGIENRFKTTRHARKSILHARCAPRIIGNWNFTVGRRLAWHLTAISPHRYVLSPA